MQNAKRIVYVLVFAVAAEALWLFAPLLLVSYSAQRDARTALGWINRDLRGYQLTEEAERQLRQVGFEGELDNLQLSKNGNVGHLKFTWVKRVYLFDYEIIAMPIEIDVEHDLMGPHGR